DMLDFADVIAINKFDKRGALDALRDVKKQYRRNHNNWEISDDDIPVYGTIASQFNDPGTNKLFLKLVDTLNAKTEGSFSHTVQFTTGDSEKIFIIPPDRIRYLSEITENNRNYNKTAEKQAQIA